MTDQQPLDLDAWRAALNDGSFEDVSAALEAVVARLEHGQLRLEDSLTCYELGVHLAERCEHILTITELRVSRLTPATADDDPWDADTDPFDQ